MAEQTTTLCWLAAFIWLLPKRQRFRFFSQFHPELRNFFWQEMAPMVVEKDAFSLQLPFSGEFWLKGKANQPKVQVRFVVPLRVGEREISVPLEISKSVANGRVTMKVADGDALLPVLVSAVKGLSEGEQHFLWSLLDEALADYEDYLLATDRELVRKHEEALAEIERGEYVVYGEAGGQ